MTCPSCKHKNPHSQKFCGNCGARLVPSPEKGAAERKRVTVLVAELSGFASRSEALSPEEALALWTRCREALEGVVRKYQGTLVNTWGDRALAFYGFPKGPERALRAAMEMPFAVAGVSQGLNPPLSIAAGIHCGEAILAPAEGQDPKGYTFLGQTVKLAQALQGLAQPGEVLGSEQIVREVEGLFDFEATTSISLPAVQDLPLTVYRLLGIRRAGIGRALTPFVGREEEMEAMKAWAQEALNGEGRVLCVVGEAGVGKSRLKYELRRFLAQHHAEVVETKALSSGRNFSYWVFREVLRELLRLSPQEGRSEIHARLAVLGGVLELGSQDIEHLAWLLHAESRSQSGASRLDPRAQKAATFLAMKRLLLTLAGRRPLVLVFEEMQWSDSLTRELLTFLVRAISKVPILIFCLYRPEYEPEWAGWEKVKVIPLSELGLEASRRLMAGLLGWKEVPQELAQAVLERAEGNPFFLEELLRSLSEQGVLAWRGERCELVGRLEEAQLPDLLQALIAARIERLPEAEKRVLQAAAVIGRSFPLALLERVCSDSPVKAEREVLSGLEEAGMMFLKARDGEPEYYFKQLLTQEEVYHSLSRTQAQELHGKVARALEAVYPDRNQDFLELLAWHYGQAREAKKEIEYLLASGDKQRENGQMSEAIAAYGQALELLLNPPEALSQDANEERRKRYQAHFGRAKAYQSLGRLSEGIADFERALEAAELLGDPGSTSPALNALAALLCRLARYPEALAHADRALKLAEAASLEPEIAASLAHQGEVLREQGNAEQAIALFEQAVARYRKLGGRQALAEGLNQLAQLCAEQGQFDRALTLYEEAVAIRRELGDSYGLASSLALLGDLRSQRGDRLEALTAYEESLSIQRELGDKLGVASSLIRQGKFLAAQGETAKALAAYQESAVLDREMGDRRALASSLTASGELLRALGQNAEALEAYEEAFLIQMQMGDRFEMGKALGAIGELHALGGRYEDALRSQGEAAALHRELGNGMELARDLARLGDILLSLDRPEEALAKVEEGLGLAVGLHSRQTRADLLVTLGRIKTLLGSADDAWDAIMEGMDQARELSLQGVVVKGWLALGDLAVEKGDGKESKKCYEAGFDAARAAGLAFWTKELERKMGHVESDQGEGG